MRRKNDCGNASPVARAAEGVMANLPVIVCTLVVMAATALEFLSN